MKFEYFDEEWEESPDCALRIKDRVVDLWESEYKDRPQAWTAVATPEADAGKYSQTHGGLY